MLFQHYTDYSISFTSSVVAFTGWMFPNHKPKIQSRLHTKGFGLVTCVHNGPLFLNHVACNSKIFYIHRYKACVQPDFSNLIVESSQNAVLKRLLLLCNKKHVLPYIFSYTFIKIKSLFASERFAKTLKILWIKILITVNLKCKITLSHCQDSFLKRHCWRPCYRKPLPFLNPGVRCCELPVKHRKHSLVTCALSVTPPPIHSQCLTTPLLPQKATVNYFRCAIIVVWL